MCADFRRLEDSLRALQKAGADQIHWDVMDGHFVPNLTFGHYLINDARQACSIPFDVHLMVEQPMMIVEKLELGPGDYIIPHLEAAQEPGPLLDEIHRRGTLAGLALRPTTPISVVTQPAVISGLDVVLLMGYQPGFPGVEMLPGTFERLNALRTALREAPNQVLIEFDGGVRLDNARELASAGADILVAGTSVFEGEGGFAEALQRLKTEVAVSTRATGERANE